MTTQYLVIPPFCNIFISQVSHPVNNSMKTVGTMPNVGSLNLCLNIPDAMQNESAQSYHRVRRKRHFLNFYLVLKQLNRSTYCIRYLETQIEYKYLYEENIVPRVLIL